VKSEVSYERIRTTNSVWYLMLPLMTFYFGDKRYDRDYFKRLIRKFCDDLHITRLSMGLVSGARASIFFDGEWESVSFDAIKELAAKGTDMLFIEKADICEVLSPFAKKYGVALVNTVGYLTEYGQDLMKEAQRSRANIAILTDYDIHGCRIVTDVLEHVKIPRIGIDEYTLRYFGLDREDKNLSVIPEGKVPKNLEFLDRLENVDKEFLREKRVEIDAVLAAVGFERFWDFIKHRLIQYYPTRDANRAITMPAVETLYTEECQELLAFINEYYTGLVEDKLEEIQDRLSNVEGMVDVEKKAAEIQDELQEVVYADDGVRAMTPLVKQLLKQLKLLAKGVRYVEK
jgi:5S rRNA maturation endonuclease (ribonuclease M5)